MLLLSLYVVAYAEPDVAGNAAVGGFGKFFGYGKAHVFCLVGKAAAVYHIGVVGEIKSVHYRGSFQQQSRGLLIFF